MKLRRRLISSAAVAAVIALICLLPTVLSFPSVFSILRDSLSPFVPGTFRIERCSLQWFGGLSCKNINYRNQRLGLEVHLPELSTDKGLFTLLVAPSYLGEVSLNQPVLDILPPDANATGQQREQKTAAPGAAQPLPASWWEQHSVRLLINRAQVRSLEAEGHAPRTLAQELRLYGELAAGTVNYRLDFQSDQTSGQFHADGFLNLPIAGQPFFNSLISQSTLKVRAMEIEPIVAVLTSRFPQLPQGQGTLNGGGTLSISGIEDLDISGEAELASLSLSGGFLGKDRPEFTRAKVVFAGKRHPLTGWHLSRLDVDSEPLSFTAKGMLDSEQVDLQGQGTADLPRLTAALPHLLSIHEATQVDRGTLKFSFLAKGKPSQVEVQAKCETSELELTQAGESYRWENPLSLQLQAQVRAASVQLRALSVHAPFLKVQGAGESEAFQLSASADLDGLFRELDKLFVLPWHARGQLQLELASEPFEQGLVRRSGELHIDHFGVHLHGKPLVPQEELSLQVQVTGKPGMNHVLEFRGGEMKASGWPGELALTLEQTAKVAADKQGKSATPCLIDASLDLGRIQSLVDGWRQKKAVTRLEGRLLVQTRGIWQGSILRLQEIEGAIEHAVLSREGQPLYKNSRVVLGQGKKRVPLRKLNLAPLQVVEKNTTPPSPRADYCLLRLHPFQLDVRQLRFHAPDITVALQVLVEGLGPAPQLTLSGTGNLALFVPWWRQQGWLDAGTIAHGQAEGSCTWRRTETKQVRSTHCSLQVNNFTLQQGESVLLSEPELDLALTMEPRAGREQSILLSSLQVKGSVGSFSGSGLAHYGRKPTLLELHGQLEPSTEFISNIVGRLLPQKVEIDQVAGGEILASVPLRAPFPFGQLTLSGATEVKGLRCLGVEVPQGLLSYELNRNTLRAELKTDTESEQVKLLGEWQKETDDFLLTIPKDTQLLKQIPLSSEVTEQLLTQLAPFGSLLTARGRIGVRMKAFSLPINGHRRQPDFNLILDLHQAQPLAINALKTLLDSAGLGKTPLRFQERELVCEGWNGAMTCAPLRLGCGSADLVITGSKSRNGRIRYKVELPVTNALLMEAGISALGQFAATAEISGTQAKPIYHHKEFLQGLAAQITARLPKPLGGNEPTKTSAE